MAPPRRSSLRADDVAAVSGKRVTRHAVHYKVDFNGDRRPSRWLKLTELSVCLHHVQDYESAANCAAGAAVRTDGRRAQRRSTRGHADADTPAAASPPLVVRHQTAAENRGTQTSPLKKRTVSRRRSDPWHCPICFDRRADLAAAGQQVCTLQCGHLLCRRCVLGSVRAAEVNDAGARALGITGEQYLRMLTASDRRVVTCPVCRASCGLATGVHAVYM